MVGPASLYVGTLRHRRFTPVTHEFRYPVFMVLLDIDRIPDAMRASPFTSYNRWNWAAFHEADHFGDARRPLRARLVDDAAGQGITLPAGRITLLTHLRYLGYCFNPVSFFYCYDTDDRLVYVMAEVNNTFGGSHRYWLAPRATGGFRSASKKALYVSPFLGTDLAYTFGFNQPGAQLTAHIDVHGGPGRPGHEDERAGTRQGTVLDATLTLHERTWDAPTIARTLLRFPWMTAAVIAGIHWQAARLWWKGVAVVPRATPRGELTLDEREC